MFTDLMEILAPMWEGVATVSIGTVGLITLSVAGYFKKGRFVMDLFYKGEKQAIELFGEENVTAFKLYAKDVKVGDIKTEVLTFTEKQLNIEKMLQFIIKTNLLNGVYEGTDLEEEANKLV